MRKFKSGRETRQCSFFVSTIHFIAPEIREPIRTRVLLLSLRNSWGFLCGREEMNATTEATIIEAEKAELRAAAWVERNRDIGDVLMDDEESFKKVLEMISAERRPQAWAQVLWER